MSSAYAWYDSHTLQVKQIGFDPNMDHAEGLAQIDIDVDLAMRIINGDTRINECYVKTQDDRLVVVHQQLQLPTKRFSELANLEHKDTMFDQVGLAGSPVRVIERVATGFTIALMAKITNITFYITMRNDPNYLIRMIDFDPFLGGDDFNPNHLYVDAGVEGDYSIYVRYHAA